jgi:hypothetical protein
MLTVFIYKLNFKKRKGEREMYERGMRGISMKDYQNQKKSKRDKEQTKRKE